MQDTAVAKNYRGRLLAGLALALEQKTLPELYTNDIAREAGVSKRTFYEHFANKEACFLALYRENSARILQSLMDAVTGQELSLLESIELGTQAYLGAMQRQSQLMKRLYIDILGLGPEGMQARREVTQQFADLITALYQDERTKFPGLPPLKPELILGVIAGLNELILFKIEDGEADQLLELVDTTRLMILAVLQGVLQGTAGDLDSFRQQKSPKPLPGGALLD